MFIIHINVINKVSDYHQQVVTRHLMKGKGKSKGNDKDKGDKGSSTDKSKGTDEVSLLS